MKDINESDILFFQKHGYVIIENFISDTLAKDVAERFALIFRGQFETTVPPDEWRWAEGRDPDNVTRMIWNGWKSDKTIASLALSEKVGYFCAKLANWHGARLNQDGCIWKPPGANGLAFHQDIQYINWVVPQDMITCWIALDDSCEKNGTIEYASGSHNWPLLQKRPEDFHDPSCHQQLIKKVAKELQKDLDIIAVKLPRGAAAFHHCRLWHGSGKNITNEHRRALALHCMPDISKFHPTNPAFAQGRYHKFNDDTMEESFYPILWGEHNTRSIFIEKYLAKSATSSNYKSHVFKGNKAPKEV